MCPLTLATREHLINLILSGESGHSIHQILLVSALEPSLSFVLSTVLMLPSPLVVVQPNLHQQMSPMQSVSFVCRRLIMLCKWPNLFRMSPTNLSLSKLFVEHSKRLVWGLWWWKNAHCWRRLIEGKDYNGLRGIENTLWRTGRGLYSLMRLRSTILGQMEENGCGRRRERGWLTGRLRGPSSLVVEMWWCGAACSGKALGMLLELKVRWMLNFTAPSWKMNFSNRWNIMAERLTMLPFSKIITPNTLANWPKSGLKTMISLLWSGLPNLQTSISSNISGDT